MKFKFFSVLMLMVLVLNYSQAQDVTEKPFRVGVKLFLPNLAGLSFEYVAPVLNGKLSAALDFSRIPINRTFSGFEAKVKITHWSLGVNYYFFKSGQGLYGGLATGQLRIKAEGNQVDDNGTVAAYYSGKDKVRFPLMIKFGAKLGKGFYFRPEIGYSLMKLPTSVSYNVTYPPNTPPTVDEVKYYDIPAIPGFASLIFNIGFGFSF